MIARTTLQVVEPSGDRREQLPESEREVLRKIKDPLARKVYEAWIRHHYGL